MLEEIGESIDVVAAFTAGKIMPMLFLWKHRELKASNFCFPEQESIVRRIFNRYPLRTGIILKKTVLWQKY